MKLRLMTYLLIFTLLIGAAAASTWVDDPTDCPTTHQSQSCFDGNKLCGYDSGIVYCYDVSSLNPPSSDTTVSSTNIAGFDGGFLLDCESYDGSSPHCDNAGAYWCDRDSSCYDINRQTNCTANTWGTSSCDTCISGYTYCDGSYTDTDGCEIDVGTTSYPSETNAHYNSSCNPACDSGYLDCNSNLGSAVDGCEIHDGSSCTVGSLSGTYDACNGCSVTKSYFETGTLTSYSSSDPLLWGKQYGAGWLLNLTTPTNTSFGINNSGCVMFADGTTQCSAAVEGEGDMTAVNTPGDYLTGGVESGVANLYINETKLNATIDALDNDTTYTNGTGLALSGTTFSVVLSYFQGLFVELTDTFGGDVSGTYDNLQLGANVTGDSEMNYTEVTLADFTNDAGYLTTSDNDTDTNWNITDSDYIYNNSGVLEVNETKLNATIDALDDDTTYTNGTGLNLTGTTFSVVLSYFQGLFIELTDTFGGDVSGTYDNLQLGSDVVGDSEMNYTDVTLADFTNDASYVNTSDVEVYNDTNLINAVNTSANIKTLGFNTTTELENKFVDESDTSAWDKDSSNDITTSNIADQNVNSSDNWDDYDTAADIGTSELNNDANFVANGTGASLTTLEVGTNLIYANGTSIGFLTSSVGAGYDFDFNGNVRIQGDLDVLGNLTSLSVENLNTNGSILPEQDATFTIGNVTHRYQYVYVSDDILVNGLSVCLEDGTNCYMGTLINTTEIEDGTIVNADIDDAAAITEVKLNLDYGTATLYNLIQATNFTHLSNFTNDLDLTNQIISHWDNITNKPANLDIDSTDDITTSNIADQNVNSSDYWDNYNTPADISLSSFNNDLSIITNGSSANLTDLYITGDLDVDGTTTLDELTVGGYISSYALYNTLTEARVGGLAGFTDDGYATTCIGWGCAIGNDGNYSIGVGPASLNANGGDHVIAIGWESGQNNNADNVLIIRDNSINPTPIIYGELDKNYVAINHRDPKSELDVNGTITTTNLNVTDDITINDHFYLSNSDELTVEMSDGLYVTSVQGEIDLDAPQLNIRGNTNFFNNNITSVGTITASNGVMNDLIVKDNDGTSLLSLEGYGTSSPPWLNIQASGSSTIGTLAETQSGQSLFYLTVNGVDSNGLEKGVAAIEVVQQGAAGEDQIPARMEISIDDGTGTVQERMYIQSKGIYVPGYDGSSGTAQNSLVVGNEGALQLEAATSAPVTCNSTNEGAMYYNSVDEVFYGCDGADWQDMVSQATVSGNYLLKTGGEITGSLNISEDLDVDGVVDMGSGSKMQGGGDGGGLAAAFPQTFSIESYTEYTNDGASGGWSWPELQLRTEGNATIGSNGITDDNQITGVISFWGRGDESGTGATSIIKSRQLYDTTNRMYGQLEFYTNDGDWLLGSDYQMAVNDDMVYVDSGVLFHPNTGYVTCNSTNQGYVYFNASNDVFLGCNGTTYIDLGFQGVGVTDFLSTSGGTVNGDVDLVGDLNVSSGTAYFDEVNIDGGHILLGDGDGYYNQLKVTDGLVMINNSAGQSTTIIGGDDEEAFTVQDTDGVTVLGVDTDGNIVHVDKLTVGDDITINSDGINMTSGSLTIDNSAGGEENVLFNFGEISDAFVVQAAGSDVFVVDTDDYHIYVDKGLTIGENVDLPIGTALNIYENGNVQVQTVINIDASVNGDNAGYGYKISMGSHSDTDERMDIGYGNIYSRGEDISFVNYDPSTDSGFEFYANGDTSDPVVEIQQDGDVIADGTVTATSFSGSVSCSDLTGATSDLCTITDTDTDTIWTISGDYLYNNSGVLTINETKLNATIEALDTDTTYLADDTYINLDGYTFTLNETKLNETIEAIATISADEIGDTEMNYSEVTLSDFTNDAGFVTAATASSKGYYYNLSASSYDGDDLGSYIIANAQCNIEFPGSHVCTGEEILQTIIDKDVTTVTSWTGTGWFHGGAPGYLADANDCLGWTSDDDQDLGRFWDFDDTTDAGMGWLTNCQNTKPLACCKNW